MNKRYRLEEIEEAVSEMEELIDTQDDIAEIDDDFQIVVSGWSVYLLFICRLLISAPDNKTHCSLSRHSAFHFRFLPLPGI